MSPQATTVLFYGLYKLACIGIGLAFAHMGYRLFLVKLPNLDPPGEAIFNFKSFMLGIKKTGPGGFFAFFGTAIVVMTIVQGFHIRQTETRPSRTPAATLPAEPPSG